MKEIRKRLVYVRHSEKGVGENAEFISARGLELAAEAATGPLYRAVREATEFFHGPLCRTSQTLLAIVTALEMFGDVHEKIDLIGNQRMFDLWKEVMAKYSGKPNIDALREGLSREAFEIACFNALNGVIEMFDLMKNGVVGLAVGHSPVIEMAAEAAGLSMRGVQLLENEAICFIRENGIITAERWKGKK